MTKLALRKLLITTPAIFMGSTMAATAKVDRRCMREYRDWLGFGPGELKRHCTPENFVTNPKEYGWYRDPTVEGCPLRRVKGSGAKQPRDALCSSE